jgi:hypothetical protein
MHFLESERSLMLAITEDNFAGDEKAAIWFLHHQNRRPKEFFVKCSPALGCKLQKQGKVQYRCCRMSRHWHYRMGAALAVNGS